MKVIGLVGTTGSGKGAVSEFFKEFGFAVIDTDAVYHEMMRGPSPCLDELRLAFGEEIIRADGALDRARLSGIVFASGAEEKRALLNKIAHKHVLDEVRRTVSELEKKDTPLVIVDAPLLFESGFDKECDSILCVSAGKDVRVERIIRRDGITKERALMRIAAQKDDSELERLSDFVIENNGDLTTLKAQVGDFISKISN